MIFNNITTPSKFLNYLTTNFNYGFTHKGKIYSPSTPNFQREMDNKYKLRIGKNFIKSGWGVCWDFCELERIFFTEKNIKHNCYFIASFVNRAEGGPTHSFLLYTKANKCFWFEFSWEQYRGIWQYNSEEEALKDIITKHKQCCNTSVCELYIITKPKQGLNTFEYVEHCINCPNITI